MIIYRTGSKVIRWNYCTRGLREPGNEASMLALLNAMMYQFDAPSSDSDEFDLDFGDVAEERLNLPRCDLNAVVFSEFFFTYTSVYNCSICM